ncbi:hypothetical protein Acr_25g0001910 [Actinidia rufa]|uniref:Uncharacterized protein n=1 Tax=Actinidia rufa TaxID=165716 RepID=A0A7J0GYA9_9ERIC|nr:hypothetical protein Acr_25g0001910 [Actinidia rufa]
MHLRSRCLPRLSASSPLDNKARPMANTSQAPNLRAFTVRYTIESPFTERVFRVRVSSKFKLPTQLGIYEGKTDPMDHLDLYKSLMSLQDRLDESKADKYIAVEELAEAKRRQRGKVDHKRKEPETRRSDYREEMKTKKWLGKIKTGPRKRNRNKYCEFHREHGHITEDYFQLKEQIADLIKKGYLRKYVVYRPPPNSIEGRYAANRPTTRDIQVIHVDILHPITFNNDDLRGLHFPHNDALIVSAVIANFNVQKILVDNGSSADILFISAFNKMKIGMDKLHPFQTPLVRFGGNTTHPLRWIKLPVTLGAEHHQITIWKDFIGIGEVRGNQKIARQCFISAMKAKPSPRSNSQ